MFAACRDAGVNTFDCADVYAKGASEQILGRLIGSCRDEVVVTSKAYAVEHGLPILATLKQVSQHAQAPEWFTTAPAGAITKLLEKTGLTAQDIDLWEINEAFAVVALVNGDKVGIPADRMNVRGGAVALGHPIGCSGARILTTLAYALKQTGKRYGIASLCIGGGEAVAMLIENPAHSDAR
jgi:acetyl-CoA C-acetyltransferase